MIYWEANEEYRSRFIPRHPVDVRLCPEREGTWYEVTQSLQFSIGYSQCCCLIHPKEAFLSRGINGILLPCDVTLLLFEEWIDLDWANHWKRLKWENGKWNHEPEELVLFTPIGIFTPENPGNF